MVEWEIGETNTERLYIIAGDDPLLYDLYIDEKNLLLVLPTTLMLICIAVTLNYPLLKYEKALIYSPLRESKHHNFGYICCDIITLEHTKVHIHIYKKNKNYILDLFDLESTKDDIQEKGNGRNNEGFTIYSFPLPILYIIGIK